MLKDCYRDELEGRGLKVSSTEEVRRGTFDTANYSFKDKALDLANEGDTKNECKELKYIPNLRNYSDVIDDIHQKMHEEEDFYNEMLTKEDFGAFDSALRTWQPIRKAGTVTEISAIDKFFIVGNLGGEDYIVKFAS